MIAKGTRHRVERAMSCCVLVCLDTHTSAHTIGARVLNSHFAVHEYDHNTHLVLRVVMNCEFQEYPTR